MTIRWGIIGCGNVAEVKSGPGFQQTPGSVLVMVMRRDAAKAVDGGRTWLVFRDRREAAEHAAGTGH